MSDTYNTRNYAAHGGGEWVVGGKLTFLEGATVDGLPAATAYASGGVLLAANQTDSAASTIAGLNVEFNALLAKLKAAGIMAPDAEG